MNNKIKQHYKTNQRLVIGNKTIYVEFWSESINHGIYYDNHKYYIFFLRPGEWVESIKTKTKDRMYRNNQPFHSLEGAKKALDFLEKYYCFQIPTWAQHCEKNPLEELEKQ